MAETKLTDEQLQALETAHKKIAIVDWNGHAIVFRRPTRDECHAYRAALEHPETKADAAEQLCQRAIVAFDGDQNANSARTYFTSTFLVEHPMFASTAKAKIALGALMGLVEEEDLADLGKGVSVRPSPRKPTPEVSPSGSRTAPAASS
jgi:hypothetical protein